MFGASGLVRHSSGFVVSVVNTGLSCNDTACRGVYRIVIHCIVIYTVL